MMEQSEEILPDGSREMRYFYDISLSGKSQYILKRKIKKQFSLEIDPYSKYFSETFIRNSSLKIEVESDTLLVRFIESGMHNAFKDTWVTSSPDRSTKGYILDKKLDQLLLPKQGYILYYQSIPKSDGDC